MMTADVSRPNSYLCFSGAMRMYQTAVDQKATSDIFYHRGRKSDFVHCRMELPFDEEKLKRNDFE